MKALSRGDQIDNYKIIEVIGHGGMGSVYRAEDMNLKIDVAIKVMAPNLIGDSDSEFLKRFIVEAQSQARLRHPNIVKVLALRRWEAGLYIVMEYIVGDTLKKHVSNGGPLEIKPAINIFSQLLDGVGYAHEHDILHRDIKPANILLTNQNEVRITDFGLARMRQQASNTGTGLFRGTIVFSSPEQLKGLKNTDHRSDIYSIGMTLFNAVTGELPFDEHDPQLPLRLIEGKTPRIDRMPLSLPKDLVQVIQLAIEADPEARYQSASDMREALNRLDSSATVFEPQEEGATVTQVAPHMKPAQPDTEKPRSIWPMISAVLLVLLAGYFAWSQWITSDPDLSSTPSTNTVVLPTPHQAVVEQISLLRGRNELDNYLADEEMAGSLVYGEATDFHTPENKLVVGLTDTTVRAVYYVKDARFINASSEETIESLKTQGYEAEIWIQILE